MVDERGLVNVYWCDSISTMVTIVTLDYCSNIFLTLVEDQVYPCEQTPSVAEKHPGQIYPPILLAN